MRLSESMCVLPGVEALLEQAGQRGVHCAIASSSKIKWVEGYLSRFGLADRFATVVTRDQVSQPKPAPDLYEEACRRLGAAPTASVALEDSANGVRAARAAGLVCVAVPNAITKRFDLSHANHVASSLAEVDLESLVSLLER